MSLTYGKLSAAVKGPIGLPAYWGIRPLSAGTEPGTFASETKAMMPSMARRPLLISARRPFSFFSGDAFFEKHARRHFNWVMREVCPAFGKAQKEVAKAEALALWREEMLARGAEELEAHLPGEGRLPGEAHRENEADENEAPAGAGSGANAEGPDAVAPGKSLENAQPRVERAAA